MSARPALARGTAGVQPNPLERAFFLVGSERSGTTLLRLMLSHHPRVECAPEFEFLVDRMPEREGWPDLEAYHESLALNRVFVPHGFTVDRTLSYPELTRSFLRQFCERSNKGIWGATCHHKFHLLPRLFPAGRFVHLLRDGRDVARSCVGMGWAGHVVYGASRWTEALRCWDLLCEAVPAEQRLEVRYEDLVTQPEPVLGRICEFLGTDFDPAIFDYAESSTYDRPDPTLVAQWRRRLSEDELGLLEAEIGDELERRGYEPSGRPTKRLGPLGRLGLFLRHKRKFYRFRIERFGLGLLVRNRIARLLGLRGMRRRATLAMNEIENRHLD